MRRIVGRISIGMVVVLFAAAPLFAQSSGNFAAKLNTTQCVINDDGTLGSGMTVDYLSTTLKTPNAAALVIRPSLVTGLFTKTTVTKLSPDVTAIAGVKVRVLLDDKTVVPPGTQAAPGVVADTDGWVYYDKRFQQLSTNIFSGILTCGTTNTDDCFLGLLLSTLSAHSIDFVADNVAVGTHTLRVQWSLESGGLNGGEAKACVGPGVLTVEQVKTFSTGGGIIVQ